MFFIVKRPDDMSRRVRLKRPDGQVTRPDARDSAVCLCGSPHPDRLVIHPDDYPTGLRIAFFPSRHISLIFLSFLSCLVLCLAYFETFFFPVLDYCNIFINLD
jgi:hypothetical protein